MQEVGVWQVTQQGPKRLHSSTVRFEQHLEAWIEKQPDLVQKGLVIVGRQVQLGARKVDLLVIDTEGRWGVIEIKKADCDRDTLAQALDYASTVGTMPFKELREKADAYLRERGTSLAELPQAVNIEEDEEDLTGEREVLLFLVGTGRTPELERMADYLSDRYRVPIHLVTYQLSMLDNGSQILLRELTESETAAVQPGRWQTSSTESLCARASQNGAGNEFRRVLDVAVGLGLYPRTWKYCITYTPPSNHGRMLFTVYANGKTPSHLSAYVSPKAFAEFFRVPEDAAATVLGPEGWAEWGPNEVGEFTKNLTLFLNNLDTGTKSGS